MKTNDEAQPGRAPRSDALPMLVVVVASTLLGMLAYTGPLGNAATLNEAFGASAAGATWVLASMSAGLAATLLAAGVIADRIGRRNVFLVGAGVFVVSNLICSLSTGTAMFVAARLLVGLGTTGMIATGLGLVAATGPSPRQQSRIATWWSVGMGGGIALGPLLSGALDLLGAWRLFYVLLAVCGLLVFLAAARVAPKDGATPLERRRSFDVLGFLLLLLFLAVLIGAIVEVRSGVSARTVLLFLAAAALLLALAASQRFGRRRLIDLSLLAHRPFLASLVGALGTGLGVIAVVAFSGTFLVAGLGLTTLQGATVTAVWATMSVLSALLFSRLTAKISGGAQIAVGLIVSGAGLLGGLGLSDAEGLPRYVVGLVVAGLATGVLNAGLARQAVATVPAKDVATGTAANNTARYLGAAIGLSAASITASTDLLGNWDAVVWGGAIASLVCALVVVALTVFDRPRAGTRAER